MQEAETKFLMNILMKKYEKSITFFCQRTVLRNGIEAFEAISHGMLFEKEIFIWSKFQGS